MFANGTFSIDEDIILYFRNFKTKQEGFPSSKKSDTTFAGSGENLSGNSEAELLKQINQGLSSEVWRIYNDFLMKRRLETLTANEAETLAKISDDIEWINNHRLLLIVELAILRKRKFDEVLSEFSIKEKTHPDSRLDSRMASIILAKSKGACEYCRSRINLAFNSFSVEMIVPQSKNGSFETRNLALVCQGCGNHRYCKTEGIDLLKHEKIKLFNPREDIWQEHFSWSEDDSTINGLTAKGRATIYELKFNRQTMVEYRSILSKVGKNPQN